MPCLGPIGAALGRCWGLSPVVQGSVAPAAQNHRQLLQYKITSCGLFDAHFCPHPAAEPQQPRFGETGSSCVLPLRDSPGTHRRGCGTERRRKRDVSHPLRQVQSRSLKMSGRGGGGFTGEVKPDPTVGLHSVLLLGCIAVVTGWILHPHVSSSEWAILGVQHPLQ